MEKNKVEKVKRPAVGQPEVIIVRTCGGRLKEKKKENDGSGGGQGRRGKSPPSAASKSNHFFHALDSKATATTTYGAPFLSATAAEKEGAKGLSRLRSSEQEQWWQQQQQDLLSPLAFRQLSSAPKAHSSNSI